MKSIEILNNSKNIINNIIKFQPKDIGKSLAQDYTIVEKKSSELDISVPKELFEHLDLSNLNVFGFTFFDKVETVNDCNCFANYHEDYLFVNSNGKISALDFYSHQKTIDFGLNFKEFLFFLNEALLFSSSTFTNSNYSKDAFVKNLKKISTNTKFESFIKKTFEQ